MSPIREEMAASVRADRRILVQRDRGLDGITWALVVVERVREVHWQIQCGDDRVIGHPIAGYRVIQKQRDEVIAVADDSKLLDKVFRGRTPCLIDANVFTALDRHRHEQNAREPRAYERQPQQRKGTQRR